MIKQVEVSPQRKTRIGTVDVSAINYRMENDETGYSVTLNETCLFPDEGESMVVGSYDDYDVIVATLRVVL